MTRVRALAPALALVIALTPAAHAQVATAVSGVVTGPAGPVPGATITVTDADGRLLATATTDAAGAFTATIALSAAAAAQGPFGGRVAATVAGNVVSRGTVTVTPGSTMPVEMSAATSSAPGAAAAGGTVTVAPASDEMLDETPGGVALAAILGAGLGIGIGLLVALFH